MALTKVIGRGLGVQGDTVTGDDAALGFTSAEGLIITGQGTTGDVTIKNDADALVAFVPTGTDDLRFPDNAQLQLGAGGNDLALYHDGSNNFIYGNNAHNLQMYTAGNLALKIDTNGHVTKPLQSAFYAHNNGTDNITDIAINAARDVPFSTELFDNNGDFASNTFTAPVTGKYNLGVSLRLQHIDSAATYYVVSIVISNLSAHFIFDPDYGQDNVYHSVRFSTLTHMDANDTAKVQVNQNGGTAQTDIQGDGSYTYFFGHLVC